MSLVLLLFQDYLEVQLSSKNLSNQTLLLRIGQLEEPRGSQWDAQSARAEPLEMEVMVFIVVT